MLIHDKDYFVLVLIYYTKIFNDQSFNGMLTNNSFELLSPDSFSYITMKTNAVGTQ